MIIAMRDFVGNRNLLALHLGDLVPWICLARLLRKLITGFRGCTVEAVPRKRTVFTRVVQEFRLLC